MAKITKSDLKGIVKECLIEILAEGLVPDRLDESEVFEKSNTLKEAVLRGSSSQSRPSRRSRKPSYLDSINFSNKESSSGKKSIDRRKADEISKKITKDPIMAAMLSDTAQTTLQEQFAAESKKGYVATGAGDNVQRVVEASTPEDLFGNETASKWASLAFDS